MLSASCDFKPFLDEALRDKVLSGLQNEALMEKLLAEPSTLAFAQA